MIRFFQKRSWKKQAETFVDGLSRDLEFSELVRNFGDEHADLVEAETVGERVGHVTDSEMDSAQEYLMNVGFDINDMIATIATIKEINLRVFEYMTPGEVSARSVDPKRLAEACEKLIDEHGTETVMLGKHEARIGYIASVTKAIFERMQG